MMYARFGWGLIRYLRTPWTVESAEAAIRADLGTREERFLQVLREQVYGNPRSPYARLLAWAGCELGDVAAGLRADGLEGTLKRLRRAGVYVSLEELKGITPIQRGSQRLAVRDSGFHNRRGRPDFIGQTSGSTGVPVSVPLYLEDLAHEASGWTAMRRGLGLDGRRLALWYPVGGAAIKNLLRWTKAGMPPERWFSMTDPALPGLEPRYRWSGRLLSAWSTVLGVPIPTAEPVSLHDLDRVLDWCVAGGPACLHTLPSSAVRLCGRASELGVSLAGTYFMVVGEPLTPDRKRAIAESGASVVGMYASTEAGRIAFGCPRAGDGVDDYHLRMDRLAVVAEPRPGGQGEAAPVLLTSLTPGSGLVLLNAGMGDTGEVHEDACGCYFESLGLHQHLRRIRSVSKFTAEGMTLLRSDVVHLLEAVLPARLGGRPGDYQLIQRQGRGGFETIEVRVSPEINAGDDATVVGTFLEEIARLRPGMRVVADIWAQAGTVRVVRSQPVPGAGKSPALRTGEMG